MAPDVTRLETDGLWNIMDEKDEAEELVPEVLGVAAAVGRGEREG